MSKMAQKLSPLDPIANASIGGGGARGLVDPTAGVVQEKKDQKAAAAQIIPTVQTATPATRARDMETREAKLLQRARAGGATRTENEADLLGYTPGVKRKTASRTLLG